MNKYKLVEHLLQKKSVGGVFNMFCFLSKLLIVVIIFAVIHIVLTIVVVIIFAVIHVVLIIVVVIIFAVIHIIFHIIVVIIFHFFTSLSTVILLVDLYFHIHKKYKIFKKLWKYSN